MSNIKLQKDCPMHSVGRIIDKEQLPMLWHSMILSIEQEISIVFKSNQSAILWLIFVWKVRYSEVLSLIWAYCLSDQIAKHLFL